MNSASSCRIIECCTNQTYLINHKYCSFDLPELGSWDSGKVLKKAIQADKSIYNSHMKPIE